MNKEKIKQAEATAILKAQGAICKRCGKTRATVDGLCDDCTIEIYGELFPWLNKTKKDK